MMITVFLSTYDLMMIIIMTIDNHDSNFSSDDDDHDDDHNEDLNSYNREGTLLC